MKLTFEQDDATQRIRGAFRLGKEYQGGPGFIHGGIIATVLDEAMGKVSRFRGKSAVTAELVVEYLKPVPVDADLVIEAHEVEKIGRNLHQAGEIRNRDGVVLARGRGTICGAGLEIGKREAGWRGASAGIEKFLNSKFQGEGQMDLMNNNLWRVKVGLAEMLKGGVIMDVTNAEQAKIAEDAGACSVMALERVPSDIRKEGGVARMAAAARDSRNYGHRVDPGDGQGAHRPFRRGAGAGSARSGLHRRERSADAG